MDSYAAFLDRKSQLGGEHGFTPRTLPSFLFDFQAYLIEWALRKGRAAIFSDCGTGKTPMQLVWADQVARHTGGRVLILAPIAVGAQTIAEGEKFGIEVTRGAGPITVANYERLHHFDPAAFAGVVCDEASILKHFDGQTRKAVTRFLLKIPYRLLATATPAPNDWSELGTSSEALGELTHTDMLEMFFKELDYDERRRALFNGRFSRRISLGVLDSATGRWRLKGHAAGPFWRWVASWAKAMRKPSDIGLFDDDDARFQLPDLIERDHVVKTPRPPDGVLFTLPAISMRQELDERRRGLEERCAKVAELVKEHDRSVIWCHLNAEGDLLERSIPNALQVAGRHDDEYKEAVLEWFLGRRCICKDERFSARVTAWQKDRLAIGSDTIASIASSCLSAQDDIGHATPTAGASTRVGITENTDGCGGLRRPSGIAATPGDGDGTQRIQSGDNALKPKCRNPSGVIQRSGSQESCADGALPLSSTEQLPRRGAPSAEDKQIQTTGGSSGSTPITATRPVDFADSSARLVILDSASLAMIQNVLNEQPCICGRHSGVRRLISKPRVCGHGLNLQHCAHVVTFASHSFESYYQCVRRCWRYGQTRPVTVDVVWTEGEIRIKERLRRKCANADAMFAAIVAHMREASSLAIAHKGQSLEVPSWL